MARRSDHTRVEIHQMAVDWVKQHLTHHSAEQLSLRKIAKAIDYSPGTLINEFGSYNLLLLHVNADTLDQLSRSMSEHLIAGMDGRAQLIAMAKAYLNFAVSHCHAWRLLFELRLMDDESLPSWQQDRIDGVLAQVKSALSLLDASATEEALEQASRVIWAGVHGISVLAIEDKLFAPSALTHEQLVESLINNYLYGWLSRIDSVSTKLNNH